MASDIKDLQRLAVSQGWRVEQTKGSHLKFIPADKSKPAVVMAGTSCSRVGFRNALSLLRKSGLIVDKAA